MADAGGDWADDGWPAGSGDAVAPPAVTKSLVHPPARYLVAASCMVVVSAALLPFTQIRAQVAGWVVGSFVTVALLAVYTAVDQRSRLSAWYSPKPNQQSVRIVICVAGILFASIHAWYIAYYFAS